MQGRLAEAVIRRPGAILALAGCVVLGAVLLLTKFKIDGNFAALLPKDDPTLQLTRELQGNVTPSRLLLVVLRGSSAEQIEEALPEIVDRLRESPFLEEVAATKEALGGAGVMWFRRAPLYALSDESLDRLEARLSGSDRLPALRSELNRMIDDPLAGKRMFLNDPLGVRWIFDEALAARFSPRLHAGSPYLILDDPPVAFLRAVGRKESFEIPYAYELIEDVNARLKNIPKGIEISLAGGYPSAIAQESSMRNDLRNTIMLSSILVIAFLTWFTRSFAAPFLMLAPIALSITCALAIGGWILGPLTPLAVSVAAILVAQGVDFTIHSFSRFRTERSTADRATAVVKAQTSLGRPFLGAAATTMAAFLTLLVSVFPGLNQFGFLLFLGTLCCLISTVVFFPILLLGADRFVGSDPLTPPWAIRAAQAIYRSRAAMPVAILTALAGVGSWVAVGLGKIPVDLNVRNTMAPSDPGLEVIAALEKDFGASMYPVFALFEADRPVDELRRAVATLKESGTIQEGVGLHTWIPPSAKRKRVESFHRRTAGWIGGTLRDLATLGVRTGPFRKSLESWNEKFSGAAPSADWLQNDEFTPLKRTLFFPPQTETHQVLRLIPSAPLWNPEDRERFDRVVRASLGEETSLYGAFHLPIHYAGILRRDLTRVAAMTVGAICLLSVIVIGSLRDGLLALLPVLVATGVTLAGCALLGGALNLLNMAAIPIILGIGVDDGIHFISRYRAQGRTDPERTILEVGPGIWGSTITTLLGFGSIALSSTPGLQSLGLLVAIGATVAFLATLFLLPPLLGNSK